MATGSVLLSPLKVGTRTVPNRIAMNAMECCDADTSGNPTETSYRRYENLFKGNAGAVTTLVDDNTTGIHRMPFGIVAATGLAHMTLNHGYLYLVDIKDGSPPNARLWKVLPGAPMKSGLLKSGDLFVACVGGNVLVSPTGEISMASPVMGEKARR